MTLLEITNIMMTAMEEAGNPPLSKSFPPSVALSASILLGNIQVR